MQGANDVAAVERARRRAYLIAAPSDDDRPSVSRRLTHPEQTWLQALKS